ncbi:B-cell lymphoma 6 protein homolog [Cloeon dipterum]|uniref:B-cell lymphoma 6 protein homolog n=1 Tax=Cloeon dipterum TaxID=197152 RepID=UPI00321F6A77
MTSKVAMDSLTRIRPNDLQEKAGELEKQYLTFVNDPTLKDDAAISEHKKQFSEMKDMCFNFLSQSKELWKSSEIDNDLILVERFQSLLSNVEKKIDELFPPARDHVEAEALKQNPNHQQAIAAAANGTLITCAKPQVFEKPIGRGKWLKLEDQPLNPVGGLMSHDYYPNAMNNFNAAVFPQAWMPSMAMPLANQQPALMTNYSGFFSMPANVLISPHGLPVGMVPLSFASASQMTQSYPCSNMVELIDLRDSDEEIYDSLQCKQQEGTASIKPNQQEAKFQLRPENKCADPASTLTNNYSPTVPTDDEQDCNIPISDTPEMPLEKATPSTARIGIDSCHLTAPPARDNPIMQPPISKCLPPKSLVNLPSQQLYEPTSSRKKITPEEYKMRKKEKPSPGAVKRSQPAKVSAPSTHQVSPQRSKPLVNRPNNVDKVPFSYEKLMSISLSYTSPISSSQRSQPSGSPPRPLKGILKKPAPLLVNQNQTPAKDPSCVNQASPKIVLEQTKEPLAGLTNHIKHLHDIGYYYCVTNEDKTKCLICKHSYKFITKHYKEKHPTSEVLISRFSPTDLQQALLEVDIQPPMEGNYRCRLCPTQLECLSTFKDHVSFHTGEYNYCCSECNFTFPEKKNFQAHWAKLHSVKHGSTPSPIELEVFPQPKSANFIPGYVCPVCNWLQLKKERVEKHVENVHGIDALRCNKINVVNMVLYIPEDNDPILSKPKKTRRRKSVIDYNEEKVDKRVKKTRKGCSGTSKSELPPVPSCSSNNSMNKNHFVEHDVNDDSVPCLICLEPYYMTTKESDWIECIECKKWLHADCTTYSETCGPCGQKKTQAVEALANSLPLGGLKQVG